MLRPDRSLSSFEAARTALRIKIEMNKIQAFVDELERLQSSLTLATILACRRVAETNNAEVVDHLRKIQDRQHALGLSSSQILPAIELLSKAVRHHEDDVQEALRVEVRKCLEPLLLSRPDFAQPRASEVHIHAPEGEICRWLDFRQMSWRCDSIDDAYRKTYEWIFETPDKYRRWDPFDTYLRVEDKQEPYFINGKAGSGKSTLMKFLLRHRRTMEHLRYWAGPNHELVAFHYFFWHSGKSLQKTYSGMPRALLHTVS